MQTETKTQTGKIKFFNKTKGFGFIQSPEQPVDVFFHATNINGAEDLGMGDTVSFETIDAKKGLAGINVTKL